MNSDRLDELECWRPDDDTPDDAKIRIPAGDLRDLVRLIPYARELMAIAERLSIVPVGDGVFELRAKGDG